MAKINLTAIIIVALIINGALIGLNIFVNKGVANTISVTGNSQMTVAPDNAVVYLLIQTRNISAQEAKNENAIVFDNVLTALIKEGIERKNIETENYNIYPEYEWDNRQELKGYIASNYIKVTTKNFDNVGKIIDASVDAGALVDYINFELSNEKNNEYKEIVLENASKDAENKAKAIANGLGKKLGKIVSVSASDYYYEPYIYYSRTTAAETNVKKIATNIIPKNLDISATVSISYEIK